MSLCCRRSWNYLEDGKAHQRCHEADSERAFERVDGASRTGRIPSFTSFSATTLVESLRPQQMKTYPGGILTVCSPPPTLRSETYETEILIVCSPSSPQRLTI